MNDLTIRVAKGYKHKHYDHVVEVYEFAEKIVTGDDYGELVINYKPRETDLQKEQRVRITQNRAKSVSGKIRGFFKRPFRADKLMFEVSHQDKEKEPILVKHSTNYGKDGQTALQYCEETALFYNDIDPNAVYWVRESVKNGESYFEPVFFGSEQVKDYQIKKGKFEYCICHSSETAQLKGEFKELATFYYFDIKGLTFSIELISELQQDGFYEKYAIGSEEPIITNVDNKSFISFFYANSAKQVPVSRVGYNYDSATELDTFVTFWDNASELYKMFINRGSEYDLSLVLHAFLQKINYYVPCDYRDDKMHACKGGTMQPSGAKCPSCGGSGMKVATSSQDVIYLKMPSEEDTIAIKPSDLVHYVNMPLDIVKLQKEEIAEFPAAICEAVLGVNLSVQQSDNPTATQVRNYYDTAQDALFEFTKAPRKMFLFTMQIIAECLGIDEGMNVALEYPNEYNLESLQELLSNLKLAKEAGATPSVIDNLSERILYKQNRSNKAFLDVYKKAKLFEPFAGLSSTLRDAIVLQLTDSNLQKALALNFKEIIDDIYLNEPDFVNLGYKAQKELIDAKAKVFSDKLIAANSVGGINDFNATDIGNDITNDGLQ